MKEFSNLFKMLLDAHHEYNPLLGEDVRNSDDDLFDDVDTQGQSSRKPNQQNVHPEATGVRLIWEA